MIIKRKTQTVTSPINIFSHPCDHKLYVSQFQSIENSKLCIDLKIPTIISHEIAQYTNGFIVRCSNDECDKHEMEIHKLKSELDPLGFGMTVNKYYCCRCQNKLKYFECCDLWQLNKICDKCVGCLCNETKCNHIQQCRECDQLYCPRLISNEKFRFLPQFYQSKAKQKCVNCYHQWQLRNLFCTNCSIPCGTMGTDKDGKCLQCKCNELNRNNERRDHVTFSWETSCFVSNISKSDII
eukprot:18836_1